MWEKLMSFLKTAVAASLLACTALISSAQAQEEVKIGVMTDMSSVFSDIVGDGSVLAAQMAVDDFIAAEKPDFKITVVSADHTSKADVASNLARTWIDQDGVDVLADVAGASVTLAVSKIGAEKDKIVLATASGQNSLSGADCQPTTLHWTYNTRAVSGAAAREIAKDGGKKWYFLTADYAGGRSLEEDATEGLKAEGGEVVGSVKHPFNEQDYSSYLLQAQGSGADVIAFANSGGPFVNAMKQAREYGLHNQAQLVGLLPNVVDLHTLGLEAAQGMTLVDPMYWGYSDETKAWSKRFFDKMGRMPTYFQAGLYSGILHYLKAVKAAGTDETQAVLAKMRELPIEDPFSKNAKIREDNMVVRDMALYRVKSPDKAEDEWDLYEFVRMIPADVAFRSVEEGGCPLVKKQ
jgi:branched-chain amino acid transport system substrate-binding protein